MSRRLGIVPALILASTALFETGAHAMLPMTVGTNRPIGTPTPTATATATPTPAPAATPATSAIVGTPQTPGATNQATLCAQPASATTCALGDYLRLCKPASASCSTILGNTYSASYQQASANIATKPVILPPTMVDQNEHTTHGTLFNALGAQSNALALGVVGTGSVNGDILRNQFDPAKGVFSFISHNPRYVAGNQAMSRCGEYAWKKWATYSWFDDLAHAKDMKLFDLATAAANVASSSSYSPSIYAEPRRMDGKPISANGTAMPYLKQGATMPRNVFFAFTPDWLDDTDPVQHQVLEALLAKQGKPLTMDEANDVQWGYERMWQLQTSEASYLDNERRMNAYADLLAHYSDIRTQIAALVSGVTPPPPPQPVLGGTTNGVVPIDGRFWNNAGERRTAIAQAVAALPPPPSSTGGMTTAKAAQIRQLQVQLLSIQDQITQTLVDESTYDDNGGCLGYRDIQGSQISGQNLQHSANYCDWLPKMISDRYVGLFQKERQAAYDKCINDTGDDWSTAISPNGNTFHDPSLQHAYNDTIDDTEQFFTNWEHRDTLNTIFDKASADVRNHMLASTTDLPIQGPASAPTAIGQSAQDQNDFGGDWFGGGYEFGASWSLTPILQDKATLPAGQTPRICRLDAKAGSHLKAHAMMLKQRFNVLDAAIGVSTSPGKATMDQGHVTILGKDLFTPLDGTDFTGKTWDLPYDYTPVDASYSTIIPVLGIPIEVGAGATVHIGVNLHAEVAPPPVCDPDNLSFSMRSSLTPYLKADARAWAGIDIGIASAGIQGKLNLVTANLPVSNTIHLTSDPNTGINLTIDNNADLQLSELSGRVDLYGEIDLGFWSDRAEVNLFSWDGFHQNIGIFHMTKSYPLNAINYRMYTNFDPRDVHVNYPPL